MAATMKKMKMQTADARPMFGLAPANARRKA
jgi:hypothetical protein